MGCVESVNEKGEVNILQEYNRPQVLNFNDIINDDDFNDIDLHSPKEFHEFSKKIIVRSGNFSGYDSPTVTIRSTNVSFHRNENELAFLVLSPKVFSRN